MFPVKNTIPFYLEAKQDMLKSVKLAGQGFRK